MIRSRREFICSNCAKKYLRWVGICSGCKKAGTVEEKQLLPPKQRTPPSAKALGQRAKRSERQGARDLTSVDGPDPYFQRIASSTGRVGHITALQIDAISRSYVMENKNRVMPSWVIKAWVIINQKAKEYNKAAILRIDPPNMPKTMLVGGKNVPLSTMAIISQERHEELISRDKALSEIETILLDYGNESATTLLVRIVEQLRGK